MDYKKSGVDIEAGYRSVELMKEHVKRTMRLRTWNIRCCCPELTASEPRLSSPF